MNLLRVPRALMLKFSDSREIQRFFSDNVSEFTKYIEKVIGAVEDNISVFNDANGLKDSGVDINDVLLKGTDIEVSSVIFGDAQTDGSWRILISGDNLNIEKLESGVWVRHGDFR